MTSSSPTSIVACARGINPSEAFNLISPSLTKITASSSIATLS